MAAKEIPAVTIAVSAATAGGVCTVASTADIWPGQKGVLLKTGVDPVTIQVTEILSTTTFRARRVEPRTAEGQRHSDLSPWHLSATFVAPDQLVGTQHDGSKLLRV